VLLLLDGAHHPGSGAGSGPVCARADFGAFNPDAHSRKSAGAEDADVADTGGNAGFFFFFSARSMMCVDVRVSGEGHGTSAVVGRRWSSGTSLATISIREKKAGRLLAALRRPAKGVDGRAGEIRRVRWGACAGAMAGLRFWRDLVDVRIGGRRSSNRGTRPQAAFVPSVALVDACTACCPRRGLAARAGRGDRRDSMVHGLRRPFRSADTLIWRLE